MGKRSAFFVTPIGGEGSVERKRSDSVLKHVLEPVLGQDFTITRADHVTTPGSINHDIIERLVQADLVLADLTGTNANVMYEIGIRHAFNEPIVQICQSNQNLPFDLGQERTIFFDLTDLAAVEDAKSKISAMVKTAMSQTYIGPVKRALNISAVSKTDYSVAEALKDLSEKIEELEDSIASMLVFDVAVDATLSGKDGEKLDHVYEVLSAVRPYEAEKLFETLRRLAKKA